MPPPISSEWVADTVSLSATGGGALHSTVSATCDSPFDASWPFVSN